MNCYNKLEVSHDRTLKGADSCLGSPPATVNGSSFLREPGNDRAPINTVELGVASGIVINRQRRDPAYAGRIHSVEARSALSLALARRVASFERLPS